MEERKRPYGDILIDFVNAPNVESATLRLFDKMEKAFDFEVGFARKAKEAFLSLDSHKRKLDALEDTRAALRGVLEGLVEHRDIYESMQIRRFIFVYDKFCAPLHDIQKGGFIFKRPPFKQEFFIFQNQILEEYGAKDLVVKVPVSLAKALPTSSYPLLTLEGSYLFRIPRLHLLEKAIAFCLVEFLKIQTNTRLIRHCIECDSFHISKTKRASRFCSDKCRLRFHNREDTASGKRAAQKRERYGWSPKDKGKREIKGKRK